MWYVLLHEENSMQLFTYAAVVTRKPIFTQAFVGVDALIAYSVHARIAFAFVDI